MFCQKCRAPLSVDPSISDLNPAAYDLLISSTPSEPTPPATLKYPHDPSRQARLEASKNPGKATIRRPLDSPMSFISLPSSQNQPRDLTRLNRLFEILSSRSDIDHPICTECTDILVASLQKQLDAANREKDAYIAYLQRVQAEQPGPEELEKQRELLAAEKQAEKEALAELEELEREKRELDEELVKLEEEARQLDETERQFWMERNEFSSQLSQFRAERNSVNAMYDHDSQLLEKLQRTNVYNDTFLISHDGTFATINGLRLGRMSNKPVEWSEINAAWGHALLLLDTVARQLGYRFVGYEVVPMGNTSRIIKLEIPPPSSSRHGDTTVKRTVLELFSSGDMPLGLTFMHRKFDNAMVAFLDLVKQLGDFVRRESAKTDGLLTMPYSIEGDRINDVSIKLGIAHDDAWSDACKYTLTCCKYLSRTPVTCTRRIKTGLEQGNDLVRRVVPGDWIVCSVCS